MNAATVCALRTRLQVRGVYCAYTPLPRTLDRSEMRLFPLGARAGRSGTLLIWGLAVYLLDGGVVRLLKARARGVTPNPKFAVSL